MSEETETNVVDEGTLEDYRQKETFESLLESNG